MKFAVILLLMTVYMNANSQTVLPLYSDSIPNSIPGPDEEKTEINGFARISKVSRPTVTVFLPEKSRSTGAAVVICPGGGYGIIAIQHEGLDEAKRFVELGVAAIVVKYRLPNDAIMPNKEIGPLQDAQRAIQLTREHATEWNINPAKIGLMGFSAGGHLASTAATHFEKSYIANPSNISLRPDFLILLYPVISFSDEIGHKGSRNNLLGPNASKEKIAEYSNELHVNSKTPPTFLVHAKDDNGVVVANSEVFYQALKKNKVKAEKYYYEKGGHGFGMINPTSDVKWMDLVFAWMKKIKMS